MSLLQRSVRSSTYNVASGLIQTLVSFVRSIFLFRLLSPEVFGVYSFASAVIILTGSFPNFGMAGALLHRAPESEGEEALRVHFTLNLIFNLIWFAVMVGPGWFFIREPNSRWVFLVILITQVVDNLTETGRTKLSRSVTFRRLAFINLLITLVGSVTAVLLAFDGFGIWSLVSTDIVSALLMLVGIYFIRPVWKPRLGWIQNRVEYFVNFGRRGFLSAPLQQTIHKIDDIWTGLFLGDNSLGFYSRAYRLATYPGILLAAPLNPVALATYAELKNKPDQMEIAFAWINGLLIRFSCLVGGWLVLIAPEFILLVAGEPWLPMINTFRLMLFFTLLDPLKITIAGIFNAIGRPEIGVKVQLMQLGILSVSLFAFGWLLGIEGVAIAVDLMVICGIVVLLRKAKAFISISIRELFVAPVLALSIAGLVVVLIYSQSSGVIHPFLNILFKSLIFLPGYLILLFFLERDRLKSMLKYGSNLFARSIESDQTDIESNP
jgi:O-antigen/teichoic acid export membrane protein